MRILISEDVLKNESSGRLSNANSSCDLENGKKFTNWLKLIFWQICRLLKSELQNWLTEYFEIFCRRRKFRNMKYQIPPPAPFVEACSGGGGVKYHFQKSIRALSFFFLSSSVSVLSAYCKNCTYPEYRTQKLLNAVQN